MPFRRHHGNIGIPWPGSEAGFEATLMVVLAKKALPIVREPASGIGNARALRKQSKCGMIQEGEGYWPNSSENLQKAKYLLTRVAHSAV